MAITDTDVATALGYANAAAIYQFNKANVLQGLVTMKAAPAGTVYARFPVYSNLATSNVEATVAGSEGDTDWTARAITVAPTDIEVLRYGTRADLTDLALHGNITDLYADAGNIIGNAVAAKFDDVITDLFDGFTGNTINSSDDAISLADWFNAIEQLRTDNAPGPYAFVGNPKQIFGTNGLSALLAVAGSNAIGTLGQAGQDIINGGYAGTLAGVAVYYSPEVAESASTCKAAMFSKQAIGVGYIDKGGGSFLEIEPQRDASKGLTELNCNAYFAAAELVDNFGCEIHTLTTA